MTAGSRGKPGKMPFLVAGVAMDEIADAFRVRPLLDETTRRQLRAWRNGEAKDPQTRRKVVRAVVAEVLPTNFELVTPVSNVLLRWTRWVDEEVIVAPLAALKKGEPRPLALLEHWISEHTVQLLGIVIAIARHAMGLPVPDRSTIPHGLRTGFDARFQSPTADLLGRCFQDLGNRSKTPVRDQIAANRPTQARYLKHATLKSHRQGRTVPNGERVDEIAAAAQNPLLRIELGFRQLMERLAPEGAEKREVNTTLLWGALVEWKAFATQAALNVEQVPPTQAVAMLSERKCQDLWLPLMGPTSSLTDLPFNLVGNPFIAIELKNEDVRQGIVLARLPGPGEHAHFTVSVLPPKPPDR